MMKMIAFAPLLFLTLAAPASAQVPDPIVTGPIRENARPGDPSRDYIFFSREGIERFGYIEQEFFIEGTANEYEIRPLMTATVASGGHRYKTRIVVRRPRRPSQFNGTVILEWQNVSAGFDIDASWAGGQEEFFIREGYAWVGVSAQRVGVQQPMTGLRDFSPVRYGTLDVTDGGTILNDALSFDIFSQAGQAVLNPTGIKPLGPLKPRRIIASGASQSAGRLNTYYNSIQPLANLMDGFLLLVSPGTTRTDLSVPLFRLLSETEVNLVARFGLTVQPDSTVLRTWQVAGAAHADRTFLDATEENATRDGVPVTPPGICMLPEGSEVRFAHVVNRAYDALVRWVRAGTAPPNGPAIQLVGDAPPRAIARDALGLALGGIRIADLAVPTALNTGINSGPGSCTLFGTHIDFDQATLDALYPTKREYVRKVFATALGNLFDGFIDLADAAETVIDALLSDVGADD
jgi:hypothetical protein